MKIILNKEKLDKLQEIIEGQLEALQQAHFGKEEVRKQITQIIISRFKSYLKIYVYITIEQTYIEKIQYK